MSLMRMRIRRSSKTTAGGQSIAHRLAVVAVIILGLLQSVETIATPGDRINEAVTVRESGGLYRVEARFSVAQPGATALTVLRDYEGIPRFLPDVRRSTVVERGNGRAVIEQEANARFMMFSRQVYLTLEVVEEPAVIRFRDRSGKSFSRYEGSWSVQDEPLGAAITYQLEAKPSFAVPEFVLKRLLKRDATLMIERLRAEMAARSGGHVESRAGGSR
jgi:ribosome-associated toxin RatA of RatAB toxin-antitoxin module